MSNLSTYWSDGQFQGMGISYCSLSLHRDYCRKRPMQGLDDASDIPCDPVFVDQHIENTQRAIKQ
jgi:RNA polymerase sigma-70 factor (ECF subfamily)